MRLVLMKDGEEMKQLPLPDSLLDNLADYTQKENVQRREGVLSMGASYLLNIGEKVCPHARLEVFAYIPSRGPAWNDAQDDASRDEEERVWQLDIPYLRAI